MIHEPYYQSGGITIYCGDCRDILPNLPVADLVIADPPYGMGKANWDVFIDPAEWLPIARNSSTVAVFCGVKAVYDYPKTDWVMAWTRIGSTQRNGKFRGFNNWEPILIYGGDRIPNDVISIANVQEKIAKSHPTSKPVKLFRELILRLGGDCIVDPFMGSGASLRAAMDLGRTAIGIERNEEYCEIAVKRLQQTVMRLDGL